MKNLRLNESSVGLIYNTTYQSSDVEVIIEENDVNSTNLFVKNPYSNQFLNINF
jgi:hypothetical protein